VSPVITLTLQQLLAVPRRRVFWKPKCCSITRNECPALARTCALAVPGSDPAASHLECLVRPSVYLVSSAILSPIRSMLANRCMLGTLIKAPSMAGSLGLCHRSSR